jgi:large subunit ribosomal protein L21
MYAVIRTGGKQYKVEKGQKLEVERLKVDGLLAADGSDVKLDAVLVVDGARVLATPTDLAKSTVSARVLGEAKGKKIRGFTYKPKSNNRRRWGHRQHYSLVEITDISLGAKSGTGDA